MDVSRRLGKKGESPILLIRLPAEALAALKRIAKARGVKLSEVVRPALERLAAREAKRKR